MMKTDIWMPLYIGDFLRDTLHLGRADIGSYLLLMTAYWARGGPLPDDDQALANISRVSLSDWSATRSIVAQFFEIEGGMWRHNRLDFEIQRAKTQQSAKRQGAAKTNAKRWGSLSESLSDSDSESDNDVPSPSPSPSVQVPPIVPQGGNGEFHLEVEVNKARKIWSPDPIQLRLNALFHRRLTNRWDEDELSAYYKLCPIDDDDLKLVEKFYTAKITQKDFRRRNLQTLLNNWNGEVDKARNYREPVEF